MWNIFEETETEVEPDDFENLVVVGKGESAYHENMKIDVETQTEIIEEDMVTSLRQQLALAQDKNSLS